MLTQWRNFCPDVEVPTCPDGEPCVCIDVDGSCDDGDDDWGYESHDDHGDEEMVYMTCTITLLC